MKILIREDKNNKWETVDSNDYTLETELQKLLADSPDVISMAELRPGAGPLIAAIREFSLPVGFIDILAFTTRGDIAVIECKLARNTQAKREVIGQILDYAAHLWEMSYEELDQSVQSMINLPLAEFVRAQSNDPDWDEEVFRANIRSALEQGNFILTIAVNEINEELNRIVRYVNSAGSPAFSFAALEMRRFHKSKIEMLVPHVFGPVHTPAAKTKQDTKQWDETSFFKDLQTKTDDAGMQAASVILNWAKANTQVWWGKGSVNGSYVPYILHKGVSFPFFAVYTYGRVEIYFQHYANKPPFDLVEKRMEILHKLNAIRNVNIPNDGIDRRPSIQLSTFTAPEALEEFLSIFDGMLEEIKKA